MDENRLRFGVGVLVVASLGIAVILTFFFGAYPNLFASRYTVRVRFPAAPGVSNETPVLKNGVRIGRVTHIELLNPLRDDGAEGVEIDMQIDDQYPLFGSEIPRITSGSLITGAAQIEFVSASPGKLLQLYDGQAETPADGQLDAAETELAKQPLQKGEVLISYGEVAKDPYEVLDMVGNLESDVRQTLVAIQQAGASVQAASQSVDSLAGQVETFVADDDEEGDLQKLTQRADRVLQEFDAAVKDIRQVIGDPEMLGGLRLSMERLPRVLESAEGTFNSARRTLEEFEGIGGSAKRTVEAAERTATSIALLAEPLGEGGADLIASLQRTLDNVDRAVVQFGTFGERINQGEGTISMLLEDDELYWQFKRIAENVERTTVRVQPIISDIRVFTDKVARDPGVIGVRGALTRRPQGLGLK
ncbi:MlaD family protein [Planctomycetaceae bacterium SH139]